MRIFKSVGRFLSISLTLALAFVLACNIYIIAVRSVTGQRQPTAFGFSSAVVISGSMSGAIEVNDMVITQARDSYFPGDIISFDTGSSIVTHRILEVTEEGFVTKGDANNTEDRNLVTEDNLVGIYKGRIPKVGDFAIFLQTPMGMLLFIGVPVLGFTVYDMIRRQRYANREKKKNDELQAELRRLRRMAGEE